MAWGGCVDTRELGGGGKAESIKSESRRRELKCNKYLKNERSRGELDEVDCICEEEPRSSNPIPP